MAHHPHHSRDGSYCSLPATPTACPVDRVVVVSRELEDALQHARVGVAEEDYFSGPHVPRYAGGGSVGSRGDGYAREPHYTPGAGSHDRREAGREAYLEDLIRKYVLQPLKPSMQTRECKDGT